MNKATFKWVLPLLGLVLTYINLSAQESFLPFYTGTWIQLLETASKQNKPIYVYWSSEHCSPCRFFEQHVLTNPQVIAFVDTHFVCYKFDGSSLSEYVHARDFFHVTAFPTHLFLSSTGIPVHRIEGSVDSVARYPERFIDWAKAALMPQNGYYALLHRYGNGERNPDFLREFLQASLNAGADNWQEIQSAYFATQPDDSVANTHNWNLMQSHLDDVNSREFRWLQSHYQSLSDERGEVAVMETLLSVALRHMDRSRYPTREEKEAGKAIFDELRGQALVSSHGESYERFLQLFMECYYRAADWGQYVQVASLYLQQVQAVPQTWLFVRADDCFWRIPDKRFAQDILDRLVDIPETECRTDCIAAKAKLLIQLDKVADAQREIHRLAGREQESPQIEYELSLLQSRLDEAQKQMGQH